MSEIITYPLGEIAKIKGGKRLPKGSLLVSVKNEHPYIRVTDMGNRFIPIDKLMYVPDDVFPSIKNYITNTNDVLLSIVGTIGEVAIVDEKLNNASLTENCVKIKPLESNLNPFYLYYFLISTKGQEEIKKGIIGSTQPKLPLYNIDKIQIPLLPIDNQVAIAEFLSSLDDKIELNLQMNQTLEAMAQAIFKEWFVKFNFPGFDGELEDGLPKGWNMGKLGDVCERITKGTTPTTLKKQFVEKGINFIKAEGIDDIGNFIPEKFAFIDEETNEMLKRSIIQENDIVFTIAGTLGRVAKVDKSILPANTNQAVAIIRVADNKMVNFVYHLLRSDVIKSTLISKAVHAVQANISLGVLSAADIVIPTEKIIQLFNEILNPIEEKLLSNVYETRTLTQIRDSLLPKLMTGKIEIQA